MVPLSPSGKTIAITIVVSHLTVGGSAEADRLDHVLNVNRDSCARSLLSGRSIFSL